MGDANRLASLASAVAGVSLLAACANLGGLDDGAADAGHDARHDSGHDAGHDTNVSLADAGLDAGDAGDGSSDAAPAVLDAGCVPTVPSDAGPQSTSACGAPAPGSCAPQAVPSFHPTTHPPRVQRGACTSAQIEEISDACFGADTSQCSSEILNSANTKCYECMFTPSSDGSYGPIVEGGNIVGELLNTGGCFALTDPCESACAATASAVAECEIASCGTDCTADTYAACATLADGCTCAAYVAAYGQCFYGPLGKSDAASACNNSNASFPVIAAAYATLFCGPSDAGT